MGFPDSKPEKLAIRKKKSNKGINNLAAAVSKVWFSIAMTFVCAIYPTFIIPWFMSASPAWRLIMTIVLHPIIYEVPVTHHDFAEPTQLCVDLNFEQQACIAREDFSFRA